METADTSLFLVARFGSAKAFRHSGQAMTTWPVAEAFPIVLGLG
jgi:hypothetical protein